VNFLAHGFRHVGDPWLVAGTALPDWLRMLDRRSRLRPDDVAPRQDDADARVASLARGVLRHFDDDRRFHGSAAFAQTRRAVADLLRSALPESEGHRPSFVAHVLLEIQLDASLDAASPGVLDAYYAALASLDPDDVDEVVRRVDPDRPARLPDLLRRFVDERFVEEYRDPALLLRRLDRVVRRVRQPPLPERLVEALPATRALVDARREQLLG
jgi:hypothetical protein